MGSKRKEEAKTLILEGKTPQEVAIVTGLSLNRCFEIRRDCGLGLRDKNKKLRQEKEKMKIENTPEETK